MRSLLILFFLFTQSAWARPEISIPGTVEISQRELLRLSDIAILTEGNNDLLSFTEAVTLKEDARELLLSQKLNSQDILAKIRESLSAHPEIRKINPSFKIPAQVKVNFSATPISREELERKIMNSLKVRCSDCDYSVAVQNIPTVLQKNWEIDFSQVTAKGGFLLPVRDGYQQQPKWVTGTIRVTKITPTTTRMILQGERIQAQDIRLDKIDVTFAKDGTLKPEEVQGQIAVRNLSVGSPIWASDIKKEPAAKKGQFVKAIIGEADFEISTMMQAEDNGYVGDLIKVKNIENQKILSGLVSEKGVVKLQ